MNVVLMSLALLGMNLLIEGIPDLSLLPAVLLIMIEILVIVAFSLFFSTLMNPQLSAIATMTIYVIGHLTNFFYDYVQVYPDKGFHWLFKVLYYSIPNLEKLNLKLAVVEHIPQPPFTVALSALYGLSWVAGLLIVTILVFNRKDFK